MSAVDLERLEALAAALEAMGVDLEWAEEFLEAAEGVGRHC